ncbi:MAG: fumarylacetoacetate hydrolase family protein [Planctomycetes bacterium]|nr:fumarylacetoacetate hydrolase family protein [Planctomycetota bacterium]
MTALRRARRPDGSPAWLWREQGRFHDLSAAGLADDLHEVSVVLLEAELRLRLLAQAPAVDAGQWPLLRPGRPGKALAIGKNFAAHAREFGAEPPEELVWFAKLPEVLIGPGEEVRIPAWLDTRVDPEAEVVVLLGEPLHEASAAEAAAAIAAYTLGNDVTARQQQGLDRDRHWPWLRSKNLATFGPFGPEWIPAAAMPPLASITLRGLVNGELRQEASLADLIWSPAAALAEISRWCPLVPGDLVFLGTPAGVAPIFPGDQLVVEAEGLGRLCNPVVAVQGSA